jgi:hypothetical protein
MLATDLALAVSRRRSAPWWLCIGASGSLLLGAASVSAQVDSGRVSGTVGAADGLPLVNAQILVVGSEARTITGRGGHFDLSALPTGRHLLEVSYIGHETQEIAVEIATGATEWIEVLLKVEPVPLEEVAVVGRGGFSPEMAGFHQRRERGTGFYFTREEISSMRARTVTDVLRRVPGASIESIPGSFGNRQAIQMGRTTGVSGGRRCEAIYIVNGQYFPISTDVGINGFVRADEIEGMEVYSGSSRIPPQFNVNNARCGVIVIWTRNGPSR